MKNIVLYVLFIMIMYDCSLHAIELFWGKEFGRKLTWYWPTFKIKGVYNHTFYTVFWTCYWFIAAMLLLIYLYIL